MRAERQKAMTKSSGTKPVVKMSKSKFPRCLRCNKRVEKLIILPAARNARNVTIEYECHGECVSQEMPAAMVADGLQSFTAFNDYTSGLMLSSSQKKPSAKKDST
ncbi:MAG: hypothetical protein NVSMB56_01780 [Pyrinomonadaceae bacterium]